MRFLVWGLLLVETLGVDPAPTDECICGEPCTITGGGQGVCQTDGTCANNIVPPNCDEDCTVCPDQSIFGSCPSTTDAAVCAGVAGCEYCANECRVACTCSDDESTSLMKACGYDGAGNPTSKVPAWPPTVPDGYYTTRAAECTCNSASTV